MIIETEVADKDKSILLSFLPIFLSGIFSDLLCSKFQYFAQS